MSKRYADIAPRLSAKRPCPTCGGDGWVFTTTRDPEPFPTCSTCGGDGWIPEAAA